MRLLWLRHKQSEIFSSLFHKTSFSQTLRFSDNVHVISRKIPSQSRSRNQHLFARADERILKHEAWKTKNSMNFLFSLLRRRCPNAFLRWYWFALNICLLFRAASRKLFKCFSLGKCGVCALGEGGAKHVTLLTRKSQIFRPELGNVPLLASNDCTKVKQRRQWTLFQWLDRTEQDLETPQKLLHSKAPSGSNSLQLYWTLLWC